jgi:hypothetical protein
MRRERFLGVRPSGARLQPASARHGCWTGADAHYAVAQLHNDIYRTVQSPPTAAGVPRVLARIRHVLSRLFGWPELQLRGWRLRLERNVQPLVIDLERHERNVRTDR